MTVRIRRRGVMLLVGLLVATIGAAVLSVWLGANRIPASTVWEVLRAGPTADNTSVVVWDQRIPRTALALAVGAALGIGGAVIQGHTRNPLTDTSILGTSAGAALAVVTAIYLGRITAVTSYVWFGLGGALIATVAVTAVAGLGRGASNPLTIVLAGTAISASLLAGASAITLIDQDSLNAFRFWSAGSVAGRDLRVLRAVAPFLLVGSVLGLASAPTLNLLGMGDDTARSLGVRIGRWRAIGLVAVTLLGGACTAAAGPISFLGLVVPHAVRMVVGPDHRWVIPGSALAGATVLLLGDTAGRFLVPPRELQVGIVLAIVGAPIFVALVRNRSVVQL